MSDGLSDAARAARAGDKLDRALHILVEALTEFWSPISGLHPEAKRMVDETVEGVARGKKKCWSNCYKETT